MTIVDIFEVISKTSDEETKSLIGMEIADDASQSRSIDSLEKVINIAFKFVDCSSNAKSYVIEKTTELALKYPFHQERILTLIEKYQ